MARIIGIVGLLLVAMATAAIADGFVRKLDVGNKSQYEKCMKAVQKKPMTQCAYYMQQEFPESLVKLKYVCCQQLESVKEACRCQAIEQMVQQVSGGLSPWQQPGQGMPWMMPPAAEQMSTERKEDLMKKASKLPYVCGLWPLYCDMRGWAATQGVPQQPGIQSVA